MADPFDREHVVRAIEDAIIPLMLRFMDVNKTHIIKTVETSYMTDTRHKKYTDYISSYEISIKMNEKYAKTLRFSFIPNEDKMNQWESSPLHRNPM